MTIKVLEKHEFDQFSNIHPYRSFYQTSSYGNLMERFHFSTLYLGFYNNSDILVGATLILFKKVFMNYYSAFAPSGFLLDYNNLDFVQELTEKLRRFLYYKRFILLTIDPLIPCAERNQKGLITSYNPDINTALTVLQACGYQHKGFNLFFENSKSRWNAIVKLQGLREPVITNFQKATRNKIHKANKSGMTIFKATKEDLKTFYPFIQRKHARSLEYYQQLFDCFGDNAELYLAKIDAYKYVEQTKNAYEKALAKSEELIAKIQDKNTKGKDLRKIINRKMEVDKVFAQEQGNLSRSTKLYQEMPGGIIVGGAIIIKQESEVHLFIEGFDQKFRSFNPNYYLKAELIQSFKEKGFSTFNLNAIVGDFKGDTKYAGLNEMKMGFSSTAIEYVGDFDYVINPIMYQLYLKRNRKKGK